MSRRIEISADDEPIRLAGILERRHEAFYTTIGERRFPNVFAALDAQARKDRRRRQTHRHKR